MDSPSASPAKVQPAPLDQAQEARRQALLHSIARGDAKMERRVNMALSESGQNTPDFHRRLQQGETPRKLGMDTRKCDLALARNRKAKQVGGAFCRPGASGTRLPQCGRPSKAQID